ncbi:DUF4440 domain-containing protein [Streptomyces sp. GESEQ-4]|uniref:nuclear transport factor 2 family protein n=1 Tax=Streptomyces sp. GESEQ-4 TaxID=2812655 RepID=UPI001B341BCD|nr:nuclear transport factor 2 family protein [Streptomyces sp. GESEQ-4]
MPENGPAVKAAIEGELKLLTPDVRRSPKLLGALLHPDFHEFGASGRHWDRASTIAALTSGTDPGFRPVVPSHLHGVQLAPDLVHLTYDTESNGTRALLRAGGGWSRSSSRPFGGAAPHRTSPVLLRGTRVYALSVAPAPEPVQAPTAVSIGVRAAS